MPPLEHRAVRRAARLLLALFLKDLSILGAWRVPLEGPVLLAGRAEDPLIARLLVLAASPRPVRMAARASRFRGALLSPLLERAGFISGVSELAPKGREELLSRCEHALVDGDAVALFAGEGPDPGQDLTKEVCERLRSRGVSLQAVPFAWSGLPRYPRRGKARLVFGPPQQGAADPGRWAVRLDPRDSSWDELEALERSRPLAEAHPAWPEACAPPEGEPGGTFLERYRWTRLSHPLKLRAALAAAREHFRLVDSLGLPADGPPQGAPAVSDRTYLRILLAAAGFPAALFGWTFLALPYCGAVWLGREWAQERTRPTGPAVLWALGLVAPVLFAFQAWLLWEVLGAAPALLLCAAALPAGAWSLFYSRVRRRVPRALVDLVRYRLRGGLSQAVGQRAAALSAALEPVLWMYRQET
jgi:hypothetical protein